MKYVNAKDILPENILKQLQTYAAGTLLYVPKEGEEKSWGEVSGYRTYLLKRNRLILNFFQYGVSLDEISNVFGLSIGTVKKIVYNKKHRTELTFRPEISSAAEYAECGLLEEWVQIWTERIAEGETTPPLIIGYAHGEFEINCDNPLFEALTRIGLESYPVIIWMTQRTDYEDFREKYGDFE